MASDLTPASELAIGAAVWVCELKPKARMALDMFLIQHARYYSGSPVELERWIKQNVLEGLAESIKKGGTIGYTLGRDVSRDGLDHTFTPAPADVLCEARPVFD